MISDPNLGKILGIRVRLHYTWIIAFGLIAGIVVTQFPEAYPLWKRAVLGVTASLLFFISIGTREIVLDFTAVRKGIPVKNVTLFVFGGISRVAGENTSQALELLLAVTGLLSTLLIAGVFYIIYIILVSAGSILVAGLIQWVAYVIFLLFLFHLIPGFPLDGGRVLRTGLWKATGDYDRATRIASWTGLAIGLLAIIGGIVTIVIGHQWFFGLLLLLMGWVLQSAASQSYRQAQLHEALQGVIVKDIMAKECPLITQELSIRQLVRDYVLVTGQRYFIVVDGEKLKGIVTIRNIKSIPRERWDSACAGGIMTPVGELRTARRRQSAVSVLDQMDELEVDRMPVLDRNKVVGVVSRDSLFRLVRTRAKLGV